MNHTCSAYYESGCAVCAEEYKARHLASREACPDGKLKGYEHHLAWCQVHFGWPTAWGTGCNCGLIPEVVTA